MCLREVEAEVKELLTSCMQSPRFRLRSVGRHPAQAADQVDLQASYSTVDRDDPVAEAAVRALAHEPGVTFARWSNADERGADWPR